MDAHNAVVAISAAIVQPWRLSIEGPECLMLHGPNDRIIDIRDAEFGAMRAEQVGAPVKLINTGIRGHASQVDAVLDGAGSQQDGAFMDIIVDHFAKTLLT